MAYVVVMMAKQSDLNFWRDKRGGPRYHALATINETEIRYAVFGLGNHWYLHVESNPDSFKHYVFHTKHEAVAFAQDDYELKKHSGDPLAFIEA